MIKRMMAVFLIGLLCAGCVRGSPVPPASSATEVPVTSEDRSPNRIEPLPCTVDIHQLQGCTLDVSLEKDSLSREESGKVQMRLTVHTYDLYDLRDISRMKAGDTISINRQDVRITSLEETQYGSVLINGGLEKGGHELRTDESGVYYETGYSDVKSYYEIGSITLPQSDTFVYVDASDLDLGEKIRSLEEFESLYEETFLYFQPGSTSVVVENGVIASLTRVYVP